MGKGNKGTKVQVSATTTETAKPEGKVQVLKVKAGMKYRGARDAWYVMLQKYDGKPANDYLEACAKSPPSVPKSGKAEKPTGWLRYFLRTGAATVVQQ